MNLIKFSCTALPFGKIGKLKCDTNGYYEVVLGGLNVFNSAGELYVYQGASKLFEESSSFMRRVKSGKLYGECGHPKMLPGMRDDDYVNRILNIWEDNISHHISDVWLDMDFGKNNPQYGNTSLIAIMGLVKPAGPKGESLKDSLDNPKENVCFSIRSFTDEVFDGRVNRKTLVKIETFDLVTEQGIYLAEKFKVPSLECLAESYVTINNLERVVSKLPIAQESSRQSVQELIDYLKPKKNYTSNTVNW